MYSQATNLENYMNRNDYDKIIDKAKDIQKELETELNNELKELQ